MPMFTMRESSKLLGISEKLIYTWAREGKIVATKDITGQMRIPYIELYRVLHEREEV